MIYTTLVSPDLLAQHMADPTWVVIDTRFSLHDPDQGRRAYRRAHIPGALYAHLDRDLSGVVVPGQTGRHPLPDVGAFVTTLSRWGVGPHKQVVVYDGGGGATAARLWWMLRWQGHQAVALLEGGWSRWQQEGHPARSGIEVGEPVQFVPQPQPHLVASAADVERARHDPNALVVDARSADRYRGENETLDPVAGHIPGAVNLPYLSNLDAAGCFLPAADLAHRFHTVLAGRDPTQIIFYCGSGVTAAHDILAVVHAGLGEGRLYPGSWSHWITDPDRPVALGPQP